MKWMALLLVLSLLLVACTATETPVKNDTQSTGNPQTETQNTNTQNTETQTNPAPTPTPTPEPTPEPTPVPTPEPVPITLGITLADLAQHDSSSDCWIAYDGQVYDITKYLPRHPGSASAISPYCGTASEFEKAFTRQHGTSQVTKLKSEGISKGALA